MRKPKLRIGLRSLMLLITLVCIVLGYRFNERHRIRRAAQLARDCGASVYYRWEHPYVAKKTISVTPAYARPPMKRIRTRSDGTTYEETFTVGYTVFSYVQVDSVARGGTEVPTHPITGFLCGTHDEVAVDAVVLNPGDVDDELVSALRDLKGLRFVMVAKPRQLFRVEVASWAPDSWRDEELAKLRAPINAATELLAAALPRLKVSTGCHLDEF